MHPSDPRSPGAAPTAAGSDPGPTAGEVSRAAASRLVAACEAAWRALQHEHPEIPDAVIVLGTGVERGRLVKLGHWWGGQWVVDDGRQAEVLLAGEALHLSPEAVFEVLAHEAAHGINAARAVKDTSRGGRYHNAAFKDAAEQLGLSVTRRKPYGWAETTLGTAARERYAGAIATIATEMRLARHVTRLVHRNGVDDARTGGAGTSTGSNGDHGGRDRGGRNSGQPLTAICGCGRRLRMAPSVLAAAPVLCGRCGIEFSAGRSAEVTGPRHTEQARTPEVRTVARGSIPPQASVPACEPSGPAAAVVDGSFLERRRRAVEDDAGRSEPYAESLRHLEDFEAALVELARRNGDPEARRTLEVFRERRAEILDWVAEVTTAQVVPFPGDAAAATPLGGAKPPPGAGPSLDLRTIDLDLVDHDEQPARSPARREPPAPEVGA